MPTLFHESFTDDMIFPRFHQFRGNISEPYVYLFALVQISNTLNLVHFFAHQTPDHPTTFSSSTLLLVRSAIRFRTYRVLDLVESLSLFGTPVEGILFDIFPLDGGFLGSSNTALTRFGRILIA